MAVDEDESPEASEQPHFKGEAIVLQPDDGPSFWQPRPANGHVTLKVGPHNCGSNFVSMGVQEIASGGYVREHWHERHEEILFCFAGAGEVVVDGTVHPFVPGTTVFVGRWVRHKIVNLGREPLRMTWTYLPPGIDGFFAGIGRPRRPGEPAPQPFARPADTLELERRAGFGPKIGE